MLLAAHNLLAGFLRRTWLVALVAVVICASFAARAVAAFSDAALAPASGPSAIPGAPPPKAAPKAAPRSLPAEGDAFVARNIFCSTCAPGPGPGPGPDYQGHPAVLIATSLGADPRATVRVVPTEVQGSWGLGEQIPGVGRLDLIDPTAIEVSDSGGHTRRISLLEPKVAGPDCGGAATPCDRAPTSPKEPSPFEGRITRINDTTYSVDRTLVRELVMGTTGSGGARAIPKVDAGGVIQGLTLIGVRKQSVAGALDLRSGDLITTIDGEQIRTAQQLIDLFARLDQISSVDIGGTRRGKPLHLTLRLR
jgi:hypothetical protein